MMGFVCDNREESITYKPNPGKLYSLSETMTNMSNLKGKSLEKDLRSVLSVWSSLCFSFFLAKQLLKKNKEHKIRFSLQA